MYNKKVLPQKVKIQKVTGFFVPVSDHTIFDKVINEKVKQLTAQQSNHTLKEILNLCREKPIHSSLNITNTNDCHQELAFSFSSHSSKTEDEKKWDVEKTKKIAITVIFRLLKNCGLVDDEKDFMHYMDKKLQTLNPGEVESVIHQAYSQWQESFKLTLKSNSMTPEGHYHADPNFSLGTG